MGLCCCKRETDEDTFIVQEEVVRLHQLITTLDRIGSSISESTDSNQDSPTLLTLSRSLFNTPASNEDMSLCLSKIYCK